MQATGDRGMINSLKKTVRTAGVRGLFDGISGTWFRQMTYSVCRFWAYDESKKLIGADAKSPAWKLALAGSMEILMVRLQGDFAKPPEKRLNYKNCIDGLFRMIREEGLSSLGRGVGPNVFRSVLMNASQLASYDFFKAELLKTGYFQDNIYVHTAASFAAGTVATTICSPADVLKPDHERVGGGEQVDAADDPAVDAARGPDVHVPGVAAGWTRLQPTTMLIFITLEQLRNAVDWYRGDA
uniref:Zn(2)-C6 fungal-type domain-containing protein n=1 Tax=Ganoderma boninense TaxID=34458 RepID=A0A5K1JVU2_9APHY|nr:Zn(2)-C6 fungal-type domain-containing protein [Ganoderma boninense]